MKRWITALIVAIAMLVSFNIATETAEASNGKTRTTTSNPTWE